MTEHYRERTDWPITGRAKRIRARPQEHDGIVKTLFTLLLTTFLATACSIGFSSPHPPIQDPCSLATVPLPSANGIGVSKASNGEYIGISNGIFAFDTTPDRTRLDRDMKCQAANQFRAGKTQDALKSWEAAHQEDTNDAEVLIYLKDQQVLASGHPHMTLVVATTLTGAWVNLGRDNLQGAYIAQTEYNDGFKLPHGLQVSLLIANFGSDPANATRVAQQIVQAAQADKTIVGVMGLPLSAYVPATIAILQQAHLPLVSSGAASDALTGLSPDFFRIVPPDAVQARIGAAYAVQTLHTHTVALFYDPNDTSSYSLANDVRQDFMAFRGVTIVAEKYTVGHPETLNTLLTDAMKQHADLLYFTGYVADLNIVLINLPASSNLTVMGSDSFYQLQDYSIGSRSGFTRLRFTAYAYPDEWSILCHSELVQACPIPSFFTSYAQAFNDGNHQDRPYGYTRANSGTIVSYDALSIVLLGSQIALSKDQATALTPNQVQSGLKTVTGTHAFQGLSGQISFGKNGDALDKSLVLLYVDPNNFIKVIPGNWIQGCFFVELCSNTRN